MIARKLREEVAEYSKKIYESGLVYGTWGNVSARNRDGGVIVITPSGIGWNMLNPDDMIVLDHEGKVLEGNLRPSVETPMHLMIYKNRDDVSGIIHTHSQAATSFAVTGKAIPPITTEFVAVIGGSVPVARYAPFGTEKLGKEDAKALGRGKAVLLANHGLVAVGKDLEDAFKVAIVVEETAKV